MAAAQAQPRMVKKFIRLCSSIISPVHQAFLEYESSGSPRLRGSLAALVTHFLFPDGCVPDDSGCHIL